jgi:signal transduction histidine kinase
MARGITENNRGEILMKRELYKQAIDKFITAISIYDSTTYFNSKVKAYINLSQAYFFDKSYNEALTTALIALNIADSLKLGKRKVEASLQLSQIYKALGNYEVAFQYLSTANLISDSLNISDNAEKAIVTREILGAEKIKSDNIRLIYENENRFKLTLITIISLVSFFIISLLLLSFSSKKKKQKFEVEAQRELIQRQESFRTKIAQELHDSIGSDILGVKLFAETIFKTKNIDDMFLKSGLDEISNIVSKVRNISHEIVSPVLFNKKTLHAAISEHIDNFQNKINMQLHLSVSQNIVWEDIDENTQHEYFRVTQEILKNAINHSEAKNINISLTVIDNFLELTITDDGKGFEYNQMKMNGIGLKNIQSRALTMKAKLTVNTSVGKGCSIKLKSAV